MKKFLKRVAKFFWKQLPISIRNAIRNIFSELAGTREIRDSFRHIYGDYTVYEKLLKGKSDVTEYHVDKLIRSVGKEITNLKAENEALALRLKKMEEKRKEN